MEKITIHRALSELKLIDAKIAKNIQELVPCGIYQKDKLIEGFTKKEDFEKSARARLQSVHDLLKRKTLIKSAIVASNATTCVKIGEKEMTVADAITFKSVIVLKKELIDRLKGVYLNAQARMNKGNDTVNQNVQKLLEAALGKDNVKTGAGEVEAIRKPYLDANEFHLFDPLSVQERIDELEKETAEFESNVDSVLSEINAVTFIEI